MAGGKVGKLCGGEGEGGGVGDIEGNGPSRESVHCPSLGSYECNSFSFSLFSP